MPRIHHGTLVANAVTYYTLDADYQNVEVLNRAAAGGPDLFFRVDGDDAEVLGNDNYIVSAGGFLQVPVPGVAGPTLITLISAGAPEYSVSGLVQ